MNLDQALEITISKNTALKEIKKHGCCINDFINDVGDKTEYIGSEVLYWLGY